MTNERIRNRRSPLFNYGVVLSIVLLFVASFSGVMSASAQETCNDPWVVQEGDTLSEIANACGTTVDALLAANPSIQDPQLIFPGQSIDIPDQAVIPDTGSPTLSIAPIFGPAGTTVQVTGAGFPANTTVYVGPGVQGAEPVFLTQVTTDNTGRFSTQLTIPGNAEAGSTWVVLASVAGQEISAFVNFSVTTAEAGVETYVVQPGDTLSEIAARFGTTVNDLLEANPGIDDARLIFPGQRIAIPEPVNVIPDTGAVVYTIQTGDTLSEIAVRFGTTVEALLEANPQIEDPSLIFAGSQITIPQ